MTNPEASSKIPCEIRCVDPATVEAAASRLDLAGATWLPYTCKLSGTQESVLMVGDELAAKLASSFQAETNTSDAKILACLYSAELCECDVATVTGVAEDKVIARLQELLATGAIAHRKIQGMNYYRLHSSMIRQSIRDAVDALC